MSQENVEIVRRVTTEFSETQQVSELVSPDLVWHVGSWSAWPGQPEYHGRDGFSEFFGEWVGAYEEWTQEDENYIDAGDSQVVTTTLQRGRLRGSDSWVELRVAFLYRIENGLIARAEVYASPEAALEAAELSE
jgi:ketosteroid isomerase-like protein